MIFDRMSSFFELNDTITLTANATTSSRIIDLRLNGDLGEHAKVCILAVGTPSASTTVKLQTSANGASGWTDIGGEQAADGNVLYAGALPDGCKRFVKAVLSVGATAITGTFKVKGGLVDEIEKDSVTLQQFSTATGKWADLAASTVVTVR